jgi:hypothetical protein
MTIDQPGIYALSMADYQADPCPSPSLSSGIAHRLVTQSPLHAWHAHPRLNPNHRREDAKEFDLGACAHALLLEGEADIIEVHFDDWRKKAAQDQRDEARAMGKIPVLSKKLDESRTMAEVARDALRQFKLNLEIGKVEQVLLWKEGDIWCRARPDWHCIGTVLDYKSTAGSAEPNAWIRNQMVPLGYDMQAVHYLRGHSQTVFAPVPPQWLFLIQENYAPFACSFVGLSQAMRDVAQRKWDFARELFGRCLKENVWKGYPGGITYAEPTVWQLDDDEERRLTFEEKLEYALA